MLLITEPSLHPQKNEILKHATTCVKHKIYSLNEIDTEGQMLLATHSDYVGGYEITDTEPRIQAIVICGREDFQLVFSEYKDSGWDDKMS